MMTEGVNKGRISTEQFSKICSENPARALGMYPQKGVLSPGSDGDIILVDPNEEWVVTSDTMKSDLKYCTFDGYKAKGRVLKTFVRGELIAENGRLVAKVPKGKYIQ